MSSEPTSSSRSIRKVSKPARFEDDQIKDNKSDTRIQKPKPRGKPLMKLTDNSESGPEKAIESSESTSESTQKPKSQPRRSGKPDEKAKPSTSSKTGDSNEVRESRQIRELNFFVDKIETTPLGDSYAVIKPHLVKQFFNKQKIVEMILSKTIENKIKQSGWFITHIPRLPPLIKETGCFVFCVDGSKCFTAEMVSSDDLRPWSATKEQNDRTKINIKPNVRRHPVGHFNDHYKIVGKTCGIADYFLTEYSGRLPREERLRKKIYYMTRDNRMVGNVFIIYYYVEEGDAPVPISGLSSQLKIQIQPKPPIPIRKETTPRERTPKQETPPRVPFVENVNEFEPYENQMHRIDQIHEDTLGDDSEFGIHEDEHADGFFEEPRIMATGHVYLTLQNKRAATSVDNVLTFLVNSNNVEERHLVNQTKPLHPPLVTSNTAYAFFVNGANIQSTEVTRDDLSPWSCIGNPRNPTFYKITVRKTGLICRNGVFTIVENQSYMQCPYHLVYLFAINPKATRLTKKIFYVVNTRTRMVISHALIVYDYRTNGSIPILPEAERFIRSAGTSGLETDVKTKKDSHN